MAIYWLSAGMFFDGDGNVREKAKPLIAEFLLENKQDLGGGCWTLPGKKINSEGYRHFEFAKHRRQGHRFTYEVFKGRIPEGLYVLHSCDNPPCCNPEHLRVGTTKDNANDRVARGRVKGNGWENKTHCPQGHPYDDANTYVFENRRYCRACHKHYSKQYMRRQRERARRQRA